MMALGFIGYLAVIAAIGICALRRTRTAGDYVIGGRKLSAPVAALSAGASDMSGWLLLGLPGAVYLSGIGEAWIVIGLACGAWTCWRTVAPRLRSFSEQLDGAVTLPQFFARRVAARSRLTGIVATLLVLFFFAIYTAASFVAGAKLFEQTLGIDYAAALWIGVAVVLIYTVLGGFLAVSWTDFFQALLMATALVLVAALALLAPAAASGGGELGTYTLGALGTIGAVAWGLGYFGQPHVLARFMAIDSPRSAPRARRINIVWMSIAGAAAVAVGIGGSRYLGGGLDDPETVFIVLAGELLPAWAAGIVVAGILAAVMSTVDSQLLVASTALVEDVARPLWKTLDDRRALALSRATVAAIALAAGALAMDPSSQVLGMVAYAWAGLGASFGPAVLACLFWRRTTSASLVAGMLCGAAVTVLWRHLEGGIFDLYEIVPACIAASIAIVVCGRGAGDAEAVFRRLVGNIT